MTAPTTSKARGQARLLADIGGTHARFAWQQGAGAPLSDPLTLRCADYPAVGDALRGVLTLWRREPPPLCAIAIANPVMGDAIRMTNHHWAFSVSALRREFGFERLEVLNDFSALARALPSLAGEDVRQIGRGQAVPGRAIGVIGPGTGLGVSGLLPDGRGGWVALEGEGGHATLAAATPREREVLAQLSAQHGHVSCERVLSGQGLVDLHAVLWRLAWPDDDRPALDAAAITQAALANADPLCVEALRMFCAFLGTAAGNLALTLGALGGVYLGGGIVPRLGRFLDDSALRARFEAKGRLSGYLAQVPLFVIQAQQSPALRGAASVFDEA